MPLFIDRLPLERDEFWVGDERAVTWEPCVPVILTDLDAENSPNQAPCLPWVLDTGNSFDGLAWQWHLLASGLDPDEYQDPQPFWIRTGDGTQHPVRTRKVALWLKSNLPALRNAPFRIEPYRGIHFFPHALTQPGEEEMTLDRPGARPLLGIRAFWWARLRIQLDFSGDDPTLSVWTPDPRRAKRFPWFWRRPRPGPVGSLEDLCTSTWPREYERLLG